MLAVDMLCAHRFVRWSNGPRAEPFFPDEREGEKKSERGKPFSRFKPEKLSEYSIDMVGRPRSKA